MNQPAAARGAQSVFWNISVFDSNYFKALFDEFYFPDGSTPDYKSVEALQRYFMKWFRNERRKELLTFPVLTAAYLVDPESHLPVDQSFTEMLATEMSKGHSFFTMRALQQTHCLRVAACVMKWQTILSVTHWVLAVYQQGAFKLLQ